MNKFIASLAIFIHITACAQTNSITVADVTRITTALASDSMQGRKAGTPGAERAAQFISDEFKKAGLQPLAKGSYLQQFRMRLPKIVHLAGAVDGNSLPPQRLAALSYQTTLNVNETSGYALENINKGDDFFQVANKILRSKRNVIVFVDTSFKASFVHLPAFQNMVFENETSWRDSSNVIFYLSDKPAQTLRFELTQQIQSINLFNVVGVLPGTSGKREQVIFSAHYDHSGIRDSPLNGDSIYNGANDNASGTTAVILLAQHFKKQANNARTLVFVAFTAEEIGGFGSRYFSRQQHPDSIAAMFNIEMIGTESKWGRNSAYITGFDKTNMGAILQKNLTGSKFSFHPDPYPEQQLFYRSDNATLAQLGVPAHTVSTSKMDNEPNYHQVSDEVKTLDLENMTEVIKAIATSATTIISGKDTPTRVKPESPK